MGRFYVFLFIFVIQDCKCFNAYDIQPIYASNVYVSDPLQPAVRSEQQFYSTEKTRILCPVVRTSDEAVACV